MQLRGPQTYSKVPMRVLLAVAMLVGAALFVALRIPVVYGWAYPALAGLLLALILAMVALATFHRMKEGKARKYTMVGLGFVVFVVLYMTYALASLFAGNIQQIMGKYLSPGGTNQVVVMRTPAHEEGEPLYAYNAYPLLYQVFYLPYEQEPLKTDSPVFELQWLGEERAVLSIPDSGGGAASELVVDYTELKAQPETSDAPSGG